MTPRHASTEGGFTLVEVLVSMLILAMTSIILYHVWGGALRAVRKGREYNTITLLLQRKAVEFEAQTKDKRVDELKDSDGGDFGSLYPDYRWEIKLKPFQVPPLLPPTNDNNGTNQDQISQLIMKTMQTYFEKAVREVQISVIHTVGEKKMTYSVSNIYVDYKVELPSAL